MKNLVIYVHGKGGSALDGIHGYIVYDMYFNT